MLNNRLILIGLFRLLPKLGNSKPKASSFCGQNENYALKTTVFEINTYNLANIANLVHW